MASSSIPEIDRRLRAERNRVGERAESLRHRLREVRQRMTPGQQARLHPDAVLAAAALAGLIAGRITGGILRGLLG